MDATAVRRNGYMNATRSVGMPRDIEYQLFAQVTGRLNRAHCSEDFNELVAALHSNLALWQTIALDVADDENALPDLLRARLFYLYEFTQAQTRKILRREADVTALIDVNMSIMRGLRRSDVGPDEGADACPA